MDEHHVAGPPRGQSGELFPQRCEAVARKGEKRICLHQHHEPLLSLGGARRFVQPCQHRGHARRVLGVPHVVVVGCQPLTVDEGMGLSDAVMAAVAPAAEAVLQVVQEIYSNPQKELQP